VQSNNFLFNNFIHIYIFHRLHSGWSFHSNRPATNRVNNSVTPNNNQSLRDEEIDRIKKVLERAQRIDLFEQERVG